MGICCGWSELMWVMFQTHYQYLGGQFRWLYDGYPRSEDGVYRRTGIPTSPKSIPKSQKQRNWTNAQQIKCVCWLVLHSASFSFIAARAGVQCGLGCQRQASTCQAESHPQWPALGGESEATHRDNQWSPGTCYSHCRKRGVCFQSIPKTSPTPLRGRTFIGSLVGARACPAAWTASRTDSSRKNLSAALQSPQPLLETYRHLGSQGEAGMES